MRLPVGHDRAGDLRHQGIPHPLHALRRPGRLGRQEQDLCLSVVLRSLPARRGPGARPVRLDHLHLPPLNPAPARLLLLPARRAPASVTRREFHLQLPHARRRALPPLVR